MIPFKAVAWVAAIYLVFILAEALLWIKSAINNYSLFESYRDDIEDLLNEISNEEILLLSHRYRCDEAAIVIRLNDIKNENELIRFMLLDSTLNTFISKRSKYYKDFVRYIKIIIERKYRCWE